MFYRKEKMKVEETPKNEALQESTNPDTQRVFQWKRKWHPSFATAPAAAVDANNNSLSDANPSSRKRLHR